MQQRGRQSAAALAVVDEGATTGISVPAGLSQAERTVWLRTVNGRPGDYFGSEHVAMLVEYCRIVCRMDVIDQQVREFRPEWMADEDGLKRYDRLVSLAARLSAAAFNLARAMRLTHHAVHEAKKVVQKPMGRVWQREPKQ